MIFSFNKPACQNIRRALRKEWLLTNGLGDYCSSTILGCNTRKYHGLLVANLESPPGRHVLLSTLEESVIGAGKEFYFSCRKHPKVYFPRGHEYLDSAEVGDWPIFTYRIGQLLMKREIALVRGESTLLVRYSIAWEGEDCPPMTLRIKPLLAYRFFHALTKANEALDSHILPEPGGFSIHPYQGMPSLHLRVDGQDGTFQPKSEWCNNVNYLVEEERGFDFAEDLFCPGTFEVDMVPGSAILLSASLKPVEGSLEALWERECTCRQDLSAEGETLLGHLAREGARYLHTSPQGHLNILAGYHWFDAWGRDALISLPGLTFVAGRRNKGENILRAIGQSVQEGLIPNCFSDAGNHAFNSVDAALWYAWAVQQMLTWMPEKEDFARKECWPVLKQIIEGYRSGKHRDKGIFVDEEGLLHAGNVHTQLTWMDANVDGKPVTPRYGCPVEINALWFNALSFADHLAEKYGETNWCCPDALRQFKVNFRKRFWTPMHGGYLGDVWRDGRDGTPGSLDTCIRPNQIFAVSLPYSPLNEEDQACVVEIVRNHLLTPYGLRTLSPHNPAYQGRYEGGSAQRDGAYHQGTVWPWLLGAYSEALLRTSWDREGAVHWLLESLLPLFSIHLSDAGLGSISEIFSGNPPHAPDGCIAQAWSVAECYRMLRLLQQAEPDVYQAWEDNVCVRWRKDVDCVPVSV